MTKTPNTYTLQHQITVEADRRDVALDSPHVHHARRILATERPGPLRDTHINHQLDRAEHDGS